MKKYLLISVLLFCNCCLYATHNGGITLTVSYTGVGDVYLIKYTLHRVCPGIMPPAAIDVNYYSDTLTVNQITLPFVSSSSWSSTFCYIPNINCAGGGDSALVYADTITLQSAGLYKFFTYESTGQHYVEAFITISPGLNDHLPEFNSNPEFMFCLGDTITLTTNAIDPDGDSIVYSLVAARTVDASLTGGTPISYTPPLSSTNFLYTSTPVIFDSLNGIVSFIPDYVQVFTMVIQADEYRNGNWIGSSMRETNSNVVATGISIDVDQRIHEQITLYPNPVKEKLYIDSKEARRYSITDPAGQIIINGKYDSSIDLSDVKSGLYFLHMFTYHGSQVSRIIKE